MLKRLLSFCIFMTLPFFLFSANITIHVNSLQKRFKKFDYPNDDVTVSITMKTHITENTVNKTGESVLLVYRTHAKHLAKYAITSA